MAEQRFAEYGQKRIPIPDGMTQEQVKGQMARFFPELADPKIETEKKGEETVWKFSKKAGTKGAPDALEACRKLVAWAESLEDARTTFVGVSEFEATAGGPFEDDELEAAIEAARAAVEAADAKPVQA